MKCQHKGCKKAVVVDCIPPELVRKARQIHPVTEGALKKLIDEHMLYYCLEHCQVHGYCWLCGSYEESIKDLHSNQTGLCRQCASDWEAENNGPSNFDQEC